MLLLRVEPAEVADAGVARVVPPAPPLSVRCVMHSLHIPESPRVRSWLLAAALVIVVLAGLTVLAFRRHHG